MTNSADGDFEKREEEVLRWLSCRRRITDVLKLQDHMGCTKEVISRGVNIVDQMLAKSAEREAAVIESEDTASTAETEISQPYKRLRSLESIQFCDGVPGKSADWFQKSQEMLSATRAKDKEQRKNHSDAPDEPEKQIASRSLYWKIDVPEIRSLLNDPDALPPRFERVESAHITLLYLGGYSESQRQLDSQRESIQALQAMEGQEVELRVSRIVIEESIACAVVELPSWVPCSNSVPHVTLGTAPGVPPRYSNEVLEEMLSGRREGISTVDLPPRTIKGKIVLERSA